MSGWLIVDPGAADERRVPIDGRLRVGRECAGVAPAQRLIVDDAAISRDHLEVVLGASAVLVDTSTNGTFLNRRRVERGEPIDLADGDVIELGGTSLLYRAPTAADDPGPVARATIRVDTSTPLAVVVGDVVGYTTLTEHHGGGAVARATDRLFGELRPVLGDARGTVINYYGDAIFAGWDAARDPEAACRAVRFALRADALVRELARDLELREVDGAPLRMGWGVTLGETNLSQPAPGRSAVHGDAVNLAFRLSGLAGRDEQPNVLVSDDVAQAAPEAADYGPVQALAVKGRATAAAVRAASAAER